MRKALHCSSVAKWQSGWPNPPEEEIAHQVYTGSARAGVAANEMAAAVAVAVTKSQANDVFMPGRSVLIKTAPDYARKPRLRH
jgi:hypothetical protein